jgi:hypothetical protein
MTVGVRHSAIRLATLVLGVTLFTGALHYINIATTLESVRRLGLALPVCLLLSGLWHLARTWRIDHALGTSLGEGKVARFTASVEGQMRDLVRGNPRRLLLLMSATAVSYLLMVIEGWVILRAAGAPLTPNPALAIETLSRVASFASAFIPANLGALEPSSLAAVAAVGAMGGGAALALARRLRGLFWAGVGLALYPRARRASAGHEVVEAIATGPVATLLYLPTDPAVSVPPWAKLAGLPNIERVVRAAVRAGYSRVVVWAPEAAHPTPLARPLHRLAHEMGSTMAVATVQHEWDAAVALLRPADSVTIIGAGTSVSSALLARARQISAEPGQCIDVTAGPIWPESGLVRMTAGDARDREHVAGELAARRARALPLPSGVEVSKGSGMLAIRVADPAQLAAGEKSSAARPTRTPMRRSHGSTAASRCQSALP